MNAHTTPEPSDPNALVSLLGVIARTGIGGATIYAFMQRGLLPQPIKLGSKLAAWPADEISKINAARIAGKSHDEIKVLVAALMDSRKHRAWPFGGSFLRLSVAIST